MRAAINTVKGAVAKKDIIPILTHLHFYKGRVQASNGKIVIDAPCPTIKVDVTVPTATFIQALDSCDNEPFLKVLDGRLHITYGKFKSTIALANQEDYPIMSPDQNPVDCGQILDALTKLQPFMGRDAQRAWACGIFLNEGYSFATNNVVLVKGKTSFTGKINIPSPTVDEIVRIGKNPKHIAYGTNTATFYYEDGSWLKTSLIATDWPDLNNLIVPSENTYTVGTQFRMDVNKLIPFAAVKSPTIKISEEGIAATSDNYSASVEGYNLPLSFFRAEPLSKVLAIAQGIDFSTYPKPCYFYGQDVAGVIIGCIP